MKHIFLILLTIFSFNAYAKDDAISLIKRRGYVICATNFSVKALAYKDEEGFYKGIDADLCRYFAIAFLGKSDAFELVDTKNMPLRDVIKQNKADIILGGYSNSASQEALLKMPAASFLYYDSLKFMAYDKKDATSLIDYKGANVCIANNSPLNENNIKSFSEKHGLNFNLIKHQSRRLAKESFLLKRCQILADSEIFLNGLDVKNARIINEEIAKIPVSVFVANNNYSLMVAVKWIVNAIIVAEEIDFSKKNAEMFISSDDESVSNLLGINPKIWQSFSIRPQWLKEAVSLLGNYGEFYNKNVEALGIDRKDNNLIKNNGVLKGALFL